MVKNSIILVISQEEKKGSVEFQVFNFTNKIQTYFTFRIAQKRLFISERFEEILGKHQRLLAYLAKK